MVNYCKISDRQTKEYAKYCDVPVPLINEKANSWQRKNDTTRNPSMQELKEYCEAEDSFTKDSKSHTLIEQQEIQGVSLMEDDSLKYSGRTEKNAQWSDITLAIAEDFGTTGELLTAEAAGAELEYEDVVSKNGNTYTKRKGIKKVQGKYLPVEYNSDAKIVAESILKQIEDRNLPKENIKLNIAGNGLSNLKGKQEEYDKLVTDVIKILLDNGISISEIRSGGQTGMDEAGIKAAMALKIPASILAPRKFKFRGKDGHDHSNKEDFVRRFNPEYKDTSRDAFGAKTLYETEETRKLKEEGRKIADSIRINGQRGYRGANSIWLYMARQYGVDNENINTINAESFDDLSSDEKERIGEEYKEVMATLGRNYINLKTNDSKRLKTAKLHRLKVLQVEDSDEVFVIGELVEPGQKKSIPLFQGDKEIYTNEGKIPAVAGADGIAVQLAIQKGKTVHVFDSKDKKWKTWDGNKYVEEKAPKLSQRPLLLGRRGDEKEDGFAKSIGEENFKAILDVFNATFHYRIHGIANRTMKGLDISELGFERQDLAKKAKEYTPTSEGMSINKTNPMTKLCLDFSAQERRMRVEMLARNFSSAVDALLEDAEDMRDETLTDAFNNSEKAKAELKKYIEEYKKKGITPDKAKIKELKEPIRAYSSWLNFFSELEDDTKQRKAVINFYKLDGVFNKMKEDIEETIEYEEDDEKKAKYQKVLDNFDLLIQDALEKVQSFENFRVIPYKSDKKGKFSGEVGASQTEQMMMNDEFGDDELGSRTTGNDGWSFKIRFVDPRLSLSMLTKKALNEIPMLKPADTPRDENEGEELLDDLGNVRYMNGEYAHAVLMNELSEMIDADDFSVKEVVDGEERYKFPALEAAKTKYPWVKALIEKLNSNDELVGAFFHDFNKVFINYAKMDANGVSMPLNQPIATDSALSVLTRNYENGIELSNDVIYDTTGAIVRAKAAELLRKFNNLDNNIDKVSFNPMKIYLNDYGTINTESDAYKTSEDLANILRALGFETTPLFIFNNLESMLEVNDLGKSSYNTLKSALSTVLSMTADPKHKGKGKKTFTDDENYLVFFNRELKKIASVVGEVSELDNVQSFRDGENTRYSYSAPNYIINLVKKIRSDKRRADFLKSEYGYDELFYKNGKWQNKWIEDMAADNDDAAYLRRFLELSEVIAVTKTNEYGEDENVPYADWSPMQTYDVLFNQYFSRQTSEGRIQIANYNMPIFSDSPVCMFITGRRYMSTSEKTFKEQLLPLYTNVVKQEMRRIKLVSDRIKARNEGKDAPGLSKIQNYDKKGTEFCFFPELNTLTMDLVSDNPAYKGLTFKEVAQMFIDNNDIDGLDSTISASMEYVLNKLFNDFLNQQDMGHIVDRFENWGVTKVSKEELKSKDSMPIREGRAKEALEEYFWNSTFAASQIIQMTTSDLAFYKNAVDFQKRFKEVYASGNRLNTNSRNGRKMENTIYISDQYITSTRYDRVKKSLKRAVAEGRMTKPHMEWILGELKKINVADAQAFRNPESFKSILDMMGKWNDEMEESFQRMKDHKWDEKDLAVIWQTLKPFIFSNVRTKSGLGKEIRVSHQNKNSEFLVLAFYDMFAADSAESPFLRGIGAFFDAHPEIDLIQFESAVKAGGQGIIDLGNSRETLAYKLYGDRAVKEAIDKAARENLGDEYKNYSELERLQFGARILFTQGDISEAKYDWISDLDDKGAHNYIHELTKSSDIILSAAQEALGKEFDSAGDNTRFKKAMDYLLENGNISQEFYNDTFEDLEMDEDEIFNTLEGAVQQVTVGEDGKKTYNYNLNNEVGIEGLQYNEDVVHRLPYSDYMIAQPTPEHLMDIDDATAGSQFRNLILANITDPDFKITLNVNGKDFTLNKQEMMDLYRGAITDNLLDSFYEAAGMFANIHDLQKHIFRVIQGNPKYGTDIIEALQIIEIQDPLNSKETIEVFNLPLDLPTISNQVQELLTSAFKNRVTKQKIKGGNCIQVACVGLSKKLNILRDENDNIIGAECMLPAWSKKFYAPFMVDRVDDGGKHYQEIDIERMEKEAPDLLKMVGYRIPTENKYSMLPLIVKGFLPQQNGSSIMLPADITLIAGSDFDVDKMFLRIPAFEIDDETGIPVKVGYDLSPVGKENGKLKYDNTSILGMNKQQRDNMMIDIEFAVLTSKEGSEQVFKPGNFNTLKREARILRIINNPRYLDEFIREQYPSLDDNQVLTMMNSPEGILKMFDNPKITTNVLDDFMSKAGGDMNALTPSSYVYFHTQNMTGSALIGLYANGSSMHAKAQETQLRIADINTGKKTMTNTFYINGHKMESLHDIINKDGQYIQDVIAEFQAASVDNAKDPVLADLGQNMFTAGTTLFMVRVGMNIEEVSLMFNVAKHNLGMRSFEQKYKEITGKSPQVNTIGTTSIEMLQAALYINKYKSLFNSLSMPGKEGMATFMEELDKSGMASEDIMRFMNTIYHVFNTYKHITDLKNALKPANDIMKADSPNNAIATGFPAAIRQRREVDRVEVNMNSASFPFRGDSDDAKKTKNEFISNGVINVRMSREEMRRRLMAQRLPSMQAFYSLGIELPIYTMGKYLIQGDELLGLGTSEVSGMLEQVMRNNPNGNLSENQIKDFYREFMQFIMTITDTFGKDYDLKRQYYLTEFPAKALRLKRRIQELKDNPVVSRLKFNLRNKAEASNITYERSGKLTSDMKASIRRSLNMLLYSNNPEVVAFGRDLFMYSYYYNGFNYGPNSFGTFFDATFWNCFPEVVDKLRTFKYNNRGKAYDNMLENFLGQYLANHTDDTKDTIIKTYNSKKAAPIFNADGSVSLRAGDCYNKYNTGFNYNTFMRIDTGYGYKLYMIDSSITKDYMAPDETINYVPVPVFDEYQPVYNAQKTAKEMYSLYFNDRKKTIADKEAAEKELKDTIGATVSHKASNPSPVSITEKYTKEEVSNNPKKAYVFTENYQAYVAAHNLDDSLIEEGYNKGDQVKTGVTDNNNTAGIRASSMNTFGDTNINPNA